MRRFRAEPLIHSLEQAMTQFVGLVSRVILKRSYSISQNFSRPYLEMITSIDRPTVDSIIETMSMKRLRRAIAAITATVDLPVARPPTRIREEF